MAVPLAAAAAAAAKKYAIKKGVQWAKKYGPPAAIILFVILFMLIGVISGAGAEEEEAAKGAQCGLGTAVPVADGTQLGITLQTIRTIESGNNYTAQNSTSSASGAYQFINSTWNNFQGYPEAHLAPPAVQDAKAAQNVTNILNSHGVELVGPVWYIGHVPTASEWDKVPRGGNKLTPREYQTKWMNKYNELAAIANANPTDPNATPAPVLANTPNDGGQVALNADCAEGVVGGGDPSECPRTAEVPPIGLRKPPPDGMDLYDLCYASVTQARSPAAGRAIIWALRHLGIPYGGNGCPGTREGPNGYDCSGFVSHAYSQTGTELRQGSWSPNTAAMVGNWNKAYEVTAAQARPGDLFVYNGGGKGHVVMLLANGMKVHTNSCGKTSHITTFSEAGAHGTIKYLAIKTGEA